MRKLTVLMMAAASLFGAGTKQVFTGTITESMCGMNHQAMKITPDAKCVRECACAGALYVLAVGGKQYKLSDQATPEQFAARKVKVTGTLFEKTGIIGVDKIEAAQ
jgi:hypothetical protein